MAIDSTILRARGGVWHQKHREQGELPHTSIDPDADFPDFPALSTTWNFALDSKPFSNQQTEILLRYVEAAYVTQYQNTKPEENIVDE